MLYQGNVGIKLPLPRFFSQHSLSLDFPTLPLLDRGIKGFTQQSLGARMCTLFVFYPCNAIFSELRSTSTVVTFHGGRRQRRCAVNRP